MFKNRRKFLFVTGGIVAGVIAVAFFYVAIESEGFAIAAYGSIFGVISTVCFGLASV